MKNEAILQNLSEFENKSLLIVDDDNPLEKDWQELWKKRDFRFFKLRVYKKA